MAKKEKKLEMDNGLDKKLSQEARLKDLTKKMYVVVGTAVLFLLAFIYLLVTRIIDGKATISMVATVALATLISGGDVVMALISGGLIFGAVFMVTDYATTPVTSWGRIAFGIGCGLITFLIRQFGGYPEGVMFSILIMNAVAPFLNRLVPRKYGYGKKAGTK